MSNKFRIKDSDGNEFDVEPLPPDNDNISGCFMSFVGIAVILILGVFIYGNL